ncbi:MAG: 16S rRNA (uracil(1498)-N(3))-methyltransferase [Spirochaetia bacterium]|nr:16S rRNA (uracil(1498)-N(3))-methyltransferase [Spirochaetia bacterium]
MRVLVLESPFTCDKPYALSQKQSHYLLHVLRMQQDSRLTVRDAKGALYSVKIVSIEDGICSLQDTGETVEQEDIAQSRKLPKIHLYQSVLKGKKMDTLIRQATEIGVQSIIPVMSRHTVPVFTEKDCEKKKKRWDMICREALQQSGSPVASRVYDLLPISRIAEFHNKLSAKPIPLIYFHHEDIGTPSLIDVIDDIVKLHEDQYRDKNGENLESLEVSQTVLSLSEPPSAAIAIGPEGGFSDSDTAFLKKAGGSPVFLKTNVLRAETAAVYALGAVQTQLMK